MLRVADRFEDESDAVDFGPVPLSKSDISVPATPATGSRYGDSRKVNYPSIAAVILIHAVLIGAVLQVRHSYIRHKEEKLSVINLTPPPPPPPAAETPPPPPQAEVVAPLPVVQTPVPPKPQVVTTPEPIPIPRPDAISASIAPPSPAPAFSAPPSTVQAGDLSAQMLSGKPPRYPALSSRNKEAGTVTLSVILGTDGRVSSISVSRSSGFRRLDDAALDAVRGWRWAPQIRDGYPVMVKGVVDIVFNRKG